LAARQAHQAALQLELLARQGDLRTADQAYAELKNKIECLKPALASILDS
ncbi:MAG: hypothetical protein HQK58_17060, partial [Deltaproteobacteria bacterium]|nr:hypothetical protein [Deltaproteobacteria bacterium]